LASRKTR